MLRWWRYEQANPGALPADWCGLDPERDMAQTIIDAGFDPDAGVVIGELTRTWDGHARGSLVVSTGTGSGHSFAVQSSGPVYPTRRRR